MNAAELIKYMGLWMRWDSIPAVSRETAQKFDELWELTKQPTTIPGTYNKQLWLWTERGQIPEYANRMLQNTFSEEIAWFRVTFREINESRIVLLNNAIVFSTPYQITENDNFRIDWDIPLLPLFEWMMDQIHLCIRMMQEGGYDDWIQTHLSYRCRTGEIDRKTLWQIYPELREKQYGNLTQEEIHECLNEMQTPVPEESYIRDMTASDYFDICAICYRAIQAEGYDSMTPKELFCRHHEGRDGGLRRLPEDDPAAFADWTVCGQSHMFEICGVWLELYAIPMETGMCLELGGFAEIYLPELVRIFNALRQQKIPVEFRDSQKIQTLLDENALIEIVPGFYPYEGKNHRTHIYSNIKLCELPPDDKFQSLIEKTKWDEISESSTIQKE